MRKPQLTPSAEAKVGFDLLGLVNTKVNLKAELRQDESFVAEMNRYFAGRTSELAAQANLAVQSLVDSLRQAWDNSGKTWLGLIVLFDSLDHVRGTDFAQVRVARRIPDGGVARLFANREKMRDFFALSGGHLRDLLRLLTNAEAAATRLPFDDRLLERAQQLGVEQFTPIADDERECLRFVLRNHRVPLHTQSEWEALAGLFDRHLVLGYENGQLWYGVHPLILPDIESSDLSAS